MKLSLKKLLEKRRKPSRKIITIEISDQSNEFEKLIKWWKQMGDIGHSALCHLDVEQKSDMVKVFCDGDGSDRIYNIDVKYIQDER